MWDNLLRVDWGQLTHAYGWARDVPDMLRGMAAPDEDARAKAWDDFFGAVNHQGDFYDSTVAAIPFLIEAVANPDTPGRVAILDYFRERWREAPFCGGDPLVADPPGGVDLPIPALTDEAFAQAQKPAGGSVRDDEDTELDLDACRSMDLCAWQTARAIEAGRPTFERLLDDLDRAVAAAAAMLLLMWPQTRALAKPALIRTIANEPDPAEQARQILEFGVYATSDDEDTLERWLHHPGPVQAAAALALAWLADPAPLSAQAAAVLDVASRPDADAFARLPWAGVFERGPCITPANAAAFVLRFAESENKELRWRAVQGLSLSHATARHLSAAQVVPVLLERLSDDYNRIRAAAAVALAERGEAVLDVAPAAAPVLVRALAGHRSRDWGDPHVGLDSDASICGHAARLLAALVLRLTPAQRQQALAGVEQAARRYASRQDAYVSFGSMAASFSSISVPASSVLKTLRHRLAQPQDWVLADLFAGFSVPKSEERLSPPDCDRRLAQAYAQQPDELMAAAIEEVRAGSDRWAMMGAAQWLATLGPAAERALPALEAVAGSALDSYAQDRVIEASTFIRQSLLIAREREADTSSVATLTERLDHPDVVVRAGAAERLALLSPSPEEAAAGIPRLEHLLADEASAEIGVAGLYECGGRLVHWRHERRSPRASAARALFAIGRVPRDDRMLGAMLAEAVHAQAICGAAGMPPRFTIAQWRLAAEAAGGLALAEPRIRAARQQCRNALWPGHNGTAACEAELAEVIRVLSGRLGPS